MEDENALETTRPGTRSPAAVELGHGSRIPLHSSLPTAREGIDYPRRVRRLKEGGAAGPLRPAAGGAALRVYSWFRR
jgi:hypothetical protein